jgi:hypothetical protein
LVTLIYIVIGSRKLGQLVLYGVDEEAGSIGPEGALFESAGPSPVDKRFSLDDYWMKELTPGTFRPFCEKKIGDGLITQS